MVPRLIGVIGDSPSNERKFYLEQLTKLISATGPLIKPYLRVIFAMLGVCFPLLLHLTALIWKK